MLSLYLSANDTSKPHLAQLYGGPYKVLKQCEKFVILQIIDKTDSVSVDRLKPVFSSVSVTLAVLPPPGSPCLVPASAMMPLVSVHMKKVRFLTWVPAAHLHQNPCQAVQGSLPLSAILRPHLLGGVTVATTTTCPQPSSYRAVLQNPPWQRAYSDESISKQLSILSKKQWKALTGSLLFKIEFQSLFSSNCLNLSTDASSYLRIFSS